MLEKGTFNLFIPGRPPGVLQEGVISSIVHWYWTTLNQHLLAFILTCLPVCMLTLAQYKRMMLESLYRSGGQEDRSRRTQSYVRSKIKMALSYFLWGKGKEGLRGKTWASGFAQQTDAEGQNHSLIKRVLAKNQA